MTDEFKSLDRADLTFGELDVEAMLRAEIERLRAALNKAADDLELYGDDGTGHTSNGPQWAADQARAAISGHQQSPTDPDEGLPTAEDVRGILK